MAPPINPAATPAATPRCAWAGAGTATAETANVTTAAAAINVFFMASPFPWSKRPRTSGRLKRKFHISLEQSMNEAASFGDECPPGEPARREAQTRNGIPPLGGDDHE